MPADQKDSAATNRLLDLLRSQQTGKPTTEGNASGTIDNEIDSAPEPDPPKQRRKAKAPSVTSSIVPDTIIDTPPPVDESLAPVTSDEIMAKLGKLGVKDKTAESPVEEPSEKPPAELQPDDSGEHAAELQESELIPEHDGETVDESLSELPGVEQESTPRIDPLNFQTHKDVKPPNKLIDLLYEFSNWAFGVRRKITVQCTADTIRIMKTKSVGQRNQIHSFIEYKLPYEFDDQKITHRDDLLAHILDSLDPKMWKRDTMFRMYSSQIETLTKVFKAPPVKGNEIKELITWTAKKNLPFSSENINIDYQILESEKGELKKNVVIGVGNGETISHMIDIYKKRKFDLQSVTTIPFLDWQIFKNGYPERQRGCVALVHMNKNETTITMIKSGRMEFNREMAVGLADYQKALVQRVMVGNDAVNITEEMAFDYLMRYGNPKDTDNDIPENGISLYKISIFLRPVIERMTGEIKRSLDYFRKQVSDVECQEIYITGPGASIPNLVETFETQLDRPTEHLNPLRNGDFEFADEFELDPQMIPTYTTNFGLALNQSTGINLLPTNRKQHFQYRIFNKLAMFVAAILLPIYLILGYFTYLETGYLEGNVVTMQKQWQKLSEQSQEYFVMLDDLEYLGNYWGYLANDRINSENQLKLLKLLSSEIPENIKITSMIFRPASSQENGQAIKQDAHVDRIAMSGFVQAHAGIADIQLTNFHMRLESLNMFSSIDKEIQGNPNSDDVRLFFTLKLGIAI